MNLEQRVEELEAKLELAIELGLRDKLIPIEEVAAALNIKVISAKIKFSKDIVKIRGSQQCFLLGKTIMENLNINELNDLTFIAKNAARFREFLGVE